MPNEKTRILLVSYDLKYSSGKDYKELFEALKAEISWWHYLDSTWLIQTTKTAKELSEKLRPLLESDLYLVVEITSAYHGWLPRKAWEWMQSGFKKIREMTKNN